MDQMLWRVFRVFAISLVALACGHPLSASAIERPDLTVGGPWNSTLRLEVSNRTRGEFVDWFDAGEASATPDARYDFLANRFQAGIRILHDDLEAFFQFQHSLLDQVPDDGPGPGGIYYANTRRGFQEQAIFRQGWIKTATDLGNDRLTLTLGRTRFAEGTETTPADATLAWVKAQRVAERLIGPFDYTHVGRSFDGVTVAYDHANVNLTGFWHQPTTGGFEISGGRHMDDINLAGVSITAGNPPDLDPTDARLFWIYYGDDRDVVWLDNRPLAAREADTDDTTIHTIGANAAHVFPVGTGKLDVLAWVAGQTGDWQSQDHRAWAYALEVGYQEPDLPMRPWVRAGFFRSSGDDDPADDDHESFFQLMPTARAYASTPFYNMMNNQDAFVQLLLTPMKKLTIRSEAHYLRATEGRDFAYFGGGATKEDFFGYGGVPAQSNRDLGYLTDIALTWKPLEVLTIYAYYGHVFGGHILRSSFPGPNANYGFLDVTWAF